MQDTKQIARTATQEQETSEKVKTDRCSSVAYTSSTTKLKPLPKRPSSSKVRTKRISISRKKIIRYCFFFREREMTLQLATTTTALNQGLS